MDAAELVFDSILEYADNETVTLCSLHKPCAGNNCDRPQYTPLIDFDRVKEKWDKSLKQASHSSVDALAYNNKLCFVEIKGWKKFLENQKLLQKKSLTEYDVNVLVKKIDKKSGSYDYQKKFLDSIVICEKISGLDSISDNVPVLFVLVTDINPVNNPLELFTEQLFMLANTSTSWEKVCSDSMYNHMKNQMNSTNTYFINCKRFDEFIKFNG